MLENIVCMMFILHIIAGVIAITKTFVMKIKKGEKIKAIDVYYYAPLCILLGFYAYAVAFNPKLND